MNSSLLELAKLHFNNVQTTFQISLRSLSRWWKDLGLGEFLLGRCSDIRATVWTLPGSCYESYSIHNSN
ncbi:hypothetical protein AAC387_Pa06g2358 [Persea americana]